MSLREQFYPKSGPWVTDPKQMPLCLIPSGQLVLKTAYTASSTPSSATFFTALAKEGAQGSIAAADTYLTLADLSGAGFLFNVVAPTHSAAFIPTMRITRDGVVSTLSPSADVAAGRQLVFGVCTVGNPITTYTGTYNESHVILPNGLYDVGFQDAPVGGVTDRGASALFVLLNPLHILAYGLAALRFEKSLKVEVKASLLSGTATNRQCACTYKLDL